MKKLILFIVLCLPFFINAQDMPRHKKPKETKDPVVFDVTKNQGTVVGYDTPQELKEGLDKEASLKMYDEKQKAEKAAMLPEGGYLRLVVNRLTIESANTKWFTVIVKSPEGQEVVRETLTSSVATPIHGPVTYWLNLSLVPLKEPLKSGTMVYVIDELSKKRHEYLIKM